MYCSNLTNAIHFKYMCIFRNPCLHGGGCIALSGTTYKCQCNDNYSGINCAIANGMVTPIQSLFIVTVIGFSKIVVKIDTRFGKNLSCVCNVVNDYFVHHNMNSYNSFSANHRLE